jgi:hypothetical protein
LLSEWRLYVSGDKRIRDRDNVLIARQCAACACGKLKAAHVYATCPLFEETGHGGASANTEELRLKRSSQRSWASSDRLFKRCDMNAGIADRVMRKRRQRLTISLRDVLLRILQTWTAGNPVSRALDHRIGLTTISRPSTSLLRASEFEARAAASFNRLAATVQEGRSGRSQL